MAKILEFPTPNQSLATSAKIHLHRLHVYSPPHMDCCPIDDWRALLMQRSSSRSFFNPCKVWYSLRLPLTLAFVLLLTLALASLLCRPPEWSIYALVLVDYLMAWVKRGLSSGNSRYGIKSNE